MNKEWRPDSWINPYDEFESKPCTPAHEYLAYAAGASAMLAARDKWWRGLLQEVNEANDLKDLQERFAHLLRYTADLEAKQ